VACNGAGAGYIANEAVGGSLPAVPAKSGQPNSGGGGGAGAYNPAGDPNPILIGGNGGSGICIVYGGQ
jgi:hypothetical protein